MEKIISTHISTSEEETLLLGEKIAHSLDTSCPQIIVLIGDLGAGKTTLCKGLIHGLTGLDYEEITSPTFQYASIFSSKYISMRIAHCDLWRLSSESEFLDLGLHDLFHDHICFIEWPERVRSLLPFTTQAIIAKMTSFSTRSYTYFVPYKDQNIDSYSP